MFLAASETLQFTRSDAPRGWHGAKTQKNKLSFCSFLVHVTAQSLSIFSMSIIEHRICKAPVFAFKQRLNNRLHLYWYRHKRQLCEGCSIICDNVCVSFWYTADYLVYNEWQMYPFISLYTCRMCIYYLLSSDFHILIFYLLVILLYLLLLLGLPQLKWLYIAGYSVWEGINNWYSNEHSYLPRCGEVQLHHKEIIWWSFFPCIDQV